MTDEMKLRKRAMQRLAVCYRPRVVLLFKKLNFRLNTAIWTQPIHIHNLTQAQDPGQLRTSTIDPLV